MKCWWNRCCVQKKRYIWISYSWVGDLFSNWIVFGLYSLALNVSENLKQKKYDYKECWYWCIVKIQNRTIFNWWFIISYYSILLELLNRLLCFPLIRLILISRNHLIELFCFYHLQLHRHLQFAFFSVLLIDLHLLHLLRHRYHHLPHLLHPDWILQIPLPPIDKNIRIKIEILIKRGEWFTSTLSPTK